MAISFDALAAPFAVTGHWRSTLYALLEGVSERLLISRDDIEGTLYPTPGGRNSLVIFDAVPGGAGSAIRIARSFGEVLEAALAPSPDVTAEKKPPVTDVSAATAISPSTKNSAEVQQ